MILAVAIVLGVALSAISALHLYWAFGGVWPASDESSLIKTVIGDPKLRRMPPFGMTIVVVFALAGAALVALLLAFRLLVSLDMLITLAGILLALVFLGRGVAAYIPAWREKHPLEPFARLDRAVYSPLCLALGAGFLFLLTARV